MFVIFAMPLRYDYYAADAAADAAMLLPRLARYAHHITTTMSALINNTITTYADAAVAMP